jgi:hypothetical protein
MASRLGTSVLRKTFERGAKGAKELGEGLAGKQLEEDIKKKTRDIHEKGMNQYYNIHKYANENYDRLSKNVTLFPDTYIGGKKRRKTRRKKTRRRKTRRNRNK